MTKLNVFTKEFCLWLKNGIDNHLPKYAQDSPWAMDLSTLMRKELASPVEWSGGINFQMPKKKNDLKDFENAVLVHQALPKLTPIQAQDHRLWVRLTHLECWDYMRKRWPADAKKPESQASYIKSHYFVGGTDGRALLRNGIARLWWMAKLSFDETRANPYELTDLLFAQLDIAKNLLERSLGRSASVLQTFLQFVLDNKKSCINEGNKSRVRIRKMSISLNTRGGVSLLDCLSKDQISELLQRAHDTAC